MTTIDGFLEFTAAVQRLKDHDDSQTELTRRLQYELSACLLSAGGVLNWRQRGQALMDALDAGLVTILSDCDELEFVAVAGGGKSFGPRITSMAQVEELLVKHGQGEDDDA